MRPVIPLLLKLLAFCVAAAAGLRVRVVITSDPSTNPYANMAVQGCQQMSARDSRVVCTTTVHTESTDPEILMRDWNSTMATATDDVFFGISPFMGTVLEQLAPRYPDKVFSAVDAVVEMTGPNIMGLIFAEDHAGYLAGALAGVFTQRKKVGVIAGIPLPALKRFVNGYHSGVLSVCPTCEVYPTYLPSFGDAVLGRGAADALVAKGVDVIFGAAGWTGSAGILHAAGRGIWVIGVDADESVTTFRGRSEIDFLLSSALKRVDVAVRTTIESIIGGKRGGYNVVLDSALNGLSLATFNSTPNRDFSTSVSVSMKGSDSCETTTFSSRSNVLNLVQSSLQRKLVLTNVVTTSGDKQPLAAPANKTWYDAVAYGERTRVQANMQGHATVYIGKNQLLTFGGQTAFGEFPNDIMQLDFDPYVWAKVTLSASTAPTGRMFHAQAFDQASNKMFVYGGQTSGAGISSENWVYDVTARAWTLLNPSNAPGARTNMAFASLGRLLFVYGGIDSAGALLGDMWALDMSSSTWNRITWAPSLSASGSPPPLQHASLVAVNSTMLALYGGTLQGGAYSSTLYTFDIPTNTWSIHKTQGDARPPPAERMRAVAVDRRRVLFVGGLTAQGLSNTTWVWKLDENVFDSSAYGPLPAGLHSHSLVTFNQSAHEGACVWDPIPIFTLCTKQTVPAVVAVSGVTNRPGGGLLVSWAHPDPLPPPVGKLDIGLRLAMVSFNAIGLATALALVVFTVKHRKTPVVKAANPNLSIISLIGAAMAHLGIITSSSIDEGRTAMMLTAFLLAGGYTLIFAAIMVKNGLIYFIFASKTRFKVRTAQLLFICMFALGLQSLLVSLWFTFDTNPIVTLTISGVKWTINGYNQLWLILCSMPVVLLTVLSVFVSYKIRHVRSEFNETQYVAIASYLIAMALLVIAPVMLLLDSPLVQYIITTVLVTLTTMAVQVLFFANKVSAVYVKSFTTDSQVGAISLTPSGNQPGTISGVTASGISETSNASTASGGTAEEAGGLWCRYCKQQIRASARHGSSRTQGASRKSVSDGGGKAGKAGPARGSSTLGPTSVSGR